MVANNVSWSVSEIRFRGSLGIVRNFQITKQPPYERATECREETMSIEESANLDASTSLPQATSETPEKVFEEILNLLESYRPMWYEQELHNRAVAAVVGHHTRMAAAQDEQNVIPRD